MPSCTHSVVLLLSLVRRSLQRLHRDQSGVISLLTVFVMLGCTYLLLWVLNSAKQLDSKVRMQNAVDATGQSGVGLLARGMNAVAFANHLEADLLAAVIVMRAAESASATSTPLIQEIRPVFDQILAGATGQPPSQRPISAFRYEVVRLTPGLADEAVRNIGRANGLWRGNGAAVNPDGPQGPLMVQLWSGIGLPVGYSSEEDPFSRTLPLLDPSPEGADATYLPSGNDGESIVDDARRLRERWVRHYLPHWARDVALGDESLTALIMTRTEEHLIEMLDNLYRTTNLPMVLRTPLTSRRDLERDFMFVAVASRQHVTPTASRMFRNPVTRLAPAVTLAQVHLFLPQARYVCCPWGEWRVDERTGDEYFIASTDGWPGEWDASTQNWQAKLVPVTSPNISQILAGSSQASSVGSAEWGQLTPRQFDELLHH